MGAFLKQSKRMIVLFHTSYTSRLWCPGLIRPGSPDFTFNILGFLPVICGFPKIWGTVWESPESRF